MAKGTWPNDHTSKLVGTGIDWKAASPLAFNAPVSVWKRVSQADAIRLRDDKRYAPIFGLLSDEVKIIITEIAEGTAKKQRQAVEQQEAAGHKSTILDEITGFIEEANDAGDLAAKLRAIELKAKLHQLLNPKTQEEQVINIYVNTGVDRGA